MNSIFQGVKDAVDLVTHPQKIKVLFNDISHKTWVEIGETSDMFEILWRLSIGDKVSEAEKKQAVEQAKDLAKTIPAFGIFLLPGGMILLPLVAKIVPWDILPSAFKTSKKAVK